MYDVVRWQYITMQHLYIYNLLKKYLRRTIDAVVSRALFPDQTGLSGKRRGVFWNWSWERPLKKSDRFGLTLVFYLQFRSKSESYRASCLKRHIWVCVLNTTLVSIAVDLIFGGSWRKDFGSFSNRFTTEQPVQRSCEAYKHIRCAIFESSLFTTLPSLARRHTHFAPLCHARTWIANSLNVLSMNGVKNIRTLMNMLHMSV